MDLNILFLYMPKLLGIQFLQLLQGGAGSILLGVVAALLVSGCSGENQPSMQAVQASDVANKAFVFSDGSPFGVDPTAGAVTLTFGSMTNNQGPFRLEATGRQATGAVTFNSCDLHFTTSTFATTQGPQPGQFLQLSPCEMNLATGALQVQNVATQATATSAPGSPATDPPRGEVALVAVNDQGTTTEDTAVDLLVLNNDLGADGVSLTITQVTPGAHGTTTITAANTVRYTPASGFHSTDSFTYTVSDGQGGSATATVTVTVTHVNHAPVAHNDQATTLEDTAVEVAVLSNDTDVDGDLLTVTAVTPGAHGTTMITAANTVRYTPASGFHSTDSFTYTVSDGQGGSATATVTVTVEIFTLLVVDSGQDRVLRYDGTTGAFIDEFIAPHSGGLLTAENIQLGPDGHLYISSWSTSSVKRYDGTTGAFLDDFVPPHRGGLNNPDQLAFGPDGHLYVSDRFAAAIRRYHGATGAFLDTFVSDGRLGGFLAFTFGPDGHIYASMFNGLQCILRFNGQTGVFMDVFSCPPDASSASSGLAFGPDGHLYVGRYHLGEVWRLDATTGTFLGSLHCPGDTRVDYLTFGPDDTLYVATLEDHNVSRFDITSGACLGAFVHDVNINATSVIFVSDAP
jgi:WD40 repeat protein